MEPLPFKWQHIIFWGGLRGSLSIALVLSLPVSLPGRQLLVAMIFGAVIFSLLLQGLTISLLLRWLGISEVRPELKAYEVTRGRLLAETAALAELDQLRGQGLVTEGVYHALKPQMESLHKELSGQLSRLDMTDREVDRELKTRITSHLIAVKKARLAMLLREGLLSDDTHRQISESLNEELARLPDGHHKILEENE
jgi:CPA1 family monovalent cation:H+ antiporter